MQYVVNSRQGSLAAPARSRRKGVWYLCSRRVPPRSAPPIKAGNSGVDIAKRSTQLSVLHRWPVDHARRSVEARRASARRRFGVGVRRLAVREDGPRRAAERWEPPQTSRRDAAERPERAAEWLRRPRWRPVSESGKRRTARRGRTASMESVGRQVLNTLRREPQHRESGLLSVQDRHAGDSTLSRERRLRFRANASGRCMRHGRTRPARAGVPAARTPPRTAPDRTAAARPDDCVGERSRLAVPTRVKNRNCNPFAFAAVSPVSHSPRKLSMQFTRILRLARRGCPRGPVAADRQAARPETNRNSQGGPTDWTTIPAIHVHLLNRPQGCPMKRFAHYALEGLLRQGPHEVWVTLGRYATTDQLEAGVQRSELSRRGDIVATRVTPCYRSAPLDLREAGRSAGAFTSA